MRIYGQDDSGKRLLLRLECDSDGCGAKIRPHPEIAVSGWVGCGSREYGSWIEWDYCPSHSDLAEPLRVRMEQEIEEMKAGLR
jgi:hypothetical protein